MRPLTLLLVLLLLLACGPDGGPVELPCVPGALVGCPCADGSGGTQVCATDGASFGVCECGHEGAGGEASMIQCNSMERCLFEQCCDAIPTTACVDLMTDKMNCGECANVCPDGANGGPHCSSGRCGLSCSAPWLDCNNDPADGCEHNADMLGPC